jgi:DNA-binding transcriptional LysR family regulator
MASLHGEVIGEMTIGCSTASGKYLLPGLIASFRKLYPMVRINVNVTSRQSVMDKLLCGDVALGISSKKIPHRELEYKQFFRDDVILIVPTNHKWDGRISIRPEEILEEPIILREEAAGTRDVFMQAFLDYGISPDMFNVAMELGNAEAIEMAVEQGIGVAFLSRLAAARGLQLGYIAEVEVDGMDLTRDIYITRCERTPTTRALVKFWEFVDEVSTSSGFKIPVLDCERIPQPVMD